MKEKNYSHERVGINNIITDNNFSIISADEAQKIPELKLPGNACILLLVDNNLAKVSIDDFVQIITDNVKKKLIPNDPKETITVEDGFVVVKEEGASVVKDALNDFFRDVPDSPDPQKPLWSNGNILMKYEQQDCDC